MGYNLETDNTLIIIGDEDELCVEYVFELDSEEPDLQYFTDLPNETGESSLIIIQGGIDLEVGDEVGLFDSDGIVDGDGNTGEILVGAAVWTGEQLNVVGVESVDLSQFNGPILPGYVVGNEVTYKVWKANEDAVYDAEATYSVGSGTWGDILTVVSVLEPIFSITQEVGLQPFMLNLVSLNVVPANRTLESDKMSDISLFSGTTFKDTRFSINGCNPTS
jgi:hypothetical protein